MKNFQVSFFLFEFIFDVLFSEVGVENKPGKFNSFSMSQNPVTKQFELSEFDRARLQYRRDEFRETCCCIGRCG